MSSTYPSSGSSSGPGLNPFLQFCSPSGNDSSDGLSWQAAKKTFDAALAAVHAKGGGEIHFASGTSGNLWMRGDGLSVPGFVTSIPLRVVGHGAGHSQFGDPCATLTGGSTVDRLHPQIWVTGQADFPFVLENMIPTGGFINQIVQTWDYERTSLGAIAWRNIDQWDRTHANTGTWPNTNGDGLATVTLALGANININTIQRSSNVVTVTFTAPAAFVPVKFGGAGKGQWIRITSTNGSFASGDYQVLSTDQATFFTYAETDVDAGPVSNAGHWNSTGVAIDDRIEVISTSTTDLPTTMYKVVGATDAITVIVRDDYGGQLHLGGGNFPSTGTFNDCGTYVLQNRQYAVGLLSLKNVQGGTSVPTQDRYVNGPAVDLGGTSDGRIFIDDTSFTGMHGSIIACVDPDRVAWLLVDPGNSGAGSCYVRRAKPASGGIRMYGSNPSLWGIDASDVYGDTEIGVDSPPALEILNGNNFGYVHANRVITWDANNDSINVKVPATMGRADVRIINSGLCSGPGQVTGGLANDTWASLSVSPIASGQFGPWAGDRINGRTPDGFRGIGGVSTARYLNKVDDPSAWTVQGGGSPTIVTGQIDPFGGTGAFKITSGPQNILSYLVNQALADGDRWIWSAWLRRSGGESSGPGGYLITTSHGNPIAQTTFMGDGEWQHVVFAAIISGNSTVDFAAAIGVADTLFIFQPTLIKVPAADMTDNEFYEYLRSFRTHPIYLPAGFDGTGTGRKFVAHGGLGTAARYTVGVAQGEITLGAATGKAVELFDESGNSLGVVAPLSFTVNP